MLTSADTIALQIEYLRTNPTPMTQGCIGLQILGGAFRQLARRRNVSDNEARELLRRVAGEVAADDFKRSFEEANRLFGVCC